MSTFVRLRVVSGQKRVLVGTIVPRPGMVTSAGVVARTTPETVVFRGGSRRRSTRDVTVTVTEARKWGYPNAVGSVELVRLKPARQLAA